MTDSDMPEINEAIDLIAKYTKQNRDDLARFLGAAKVCGYIMVRTPSPAQADDMRVVREALSYCSGKAVRWHPCDTGHVLLREAIAALNRIEGKQS